MGPLGFQELLLILGLALLIFGPRELPKIGRTIGRAMGEFRKASTELKRSLNAEMIQEELRQNDPREWVRDTAKELESAAMAEDEETVEPSETASQKAEEPSAEPEADASAPVPRNEEDRDRTKTAAGS